MKGETGISLTGITEGVRHQAEGKAIDAETVKTILMESFLNDLDAAERTRDTYGRSLRQYFHYLEAIGADLGKTDRNTVLTYKKSLKDHGKKATTINAYLTAVRQFYKWAESYKAYPNVATGIRSEKTNQESPKNALTIEQARKLLATTGEAQGLQGLRDHAIINLMIRRGLRTIEISRANIEDIQTVSGESVLFIQGKGYRDKGQMVVLREECLAPIRKYLEAREDYSPADPLFTSTSNRNKGGRMTTRSISGLVSEALEATGIKTKAITAHSLRHTAVTLGLLGGASPQEVQQLARHSSIETTFIYAHNIQRMEAHAEKSIDSMLTA